MFISKKAIPRRAVLRGMGAMVALPLLDSMVPALSALANTAAKPVNRFGVMYVPNGMIMKNYLPLIEGAGFELTPTLSPLAKFREQILVLTGLECIPTPGRPGGAHAKASTRFLTDVSPPLSETWLDAGISMDQILANETGKHTQLASLELAIESSETAGACDTGFACPYTNTISWKSQNTPLPTQHNPRVVFERLFGDSGSTDPKVRLARFRQQRSVLDSVTQEVAHLQGALPQSDRTKLAEYLEAIRSVEQRIQLAEEQGDQELPLVDHPEGIPSSWEVREEGGGSRENSIHPPAHCLPGSGWDLIRVETVTIDLPGLKQRPAKVKRLLIAKGEARQLVYYWYQQQGRVIAEDWQKILFVGIDRALHGRTDGTLVRFTVPIRRDGEDGAEAEFRDLAPRVVANFPGFLPD
jgi:EpsI family protein